MNFISGDFHLHYLASYTLYIKSDFRTDYLLVIGDEGEVLVFLEYDNTNPDIEAKRILALPFIKVVINLPHQNLIWVPSDVYKAEDKGLYTSYFLEEDVNKILTKNFDALAAVALYQFDTLLVSRWLKIYPEAIFIPSFELLVNQSEKYISNTSDNSLIVHLFDNQVDVLLSVNGEFKLYNTYVVNSEDDLSYYVISLMKNFSLTDKFDQILIAGVGLESEYVNRLRLYTKHLELLTPCMNLNYESEELRKVLMSLNLLVDTALCE